MFAALISLGDRRAMYNISFFVEINNCSIYVYLPRETITFSLMQLFNNTALNLKTSCGKWNEWGFRPPLCTYRLNWPRRSS